MTTVQVGEMEVTLPEETLPRGFFKVEKKDGEVHYVNPQLKMEIGPGPGNGTSIWMGNNGYDYATPMAEFLRRMVAAEEQVTPTGMEYQKSRYRKMAIEAFRRSYKEGTVVEFTTNLDDLLFGRGKKD